MVLAALDKVYFCRWVKLWCICWADESGQRPVESQVATKSLMWKKNPLLLKSILCLQNFARLDVELSGLEFDVVNLMSDLLSHWLSVPRFFLQYFSGFVCFAGLFLLLCIFQCTGKLLWSLEQRCPAERRRGLIDRPIHVL